MLVKFLHSHKIPLQIAGKGIGPRSENLVGLLFYLLVHLIVCLLACFAWPVYCLTCLLVHLFLFALLLIDLLVY